MTDDERIIQTLTQLLPPDMAEMCSRRIREGAKTYGDLDLATDKRDFAQEAREELADAAYYLVASRRRGHELALRYVVSAWVMAR